MTTRKGARNHADQAMNIGIVGAGFIGRAVAGLAVEHGHAVMISNSRSPRTLTSTMIALKCAVGTAADAARFGDVVLLAVPFWAIPELDPAPFAGQIVMDATNYYPGRDQANPALDTHETTTSEMVQQALPGAKVVKAWNAILERDILPDAKPAGTPGRRALTIAFLPAPGSPRRDWFRWVAEGARISLLS